MNLNSKLPNLHHHYVTDVSGLVRVADSDGLSVRPPSISGGRFTFFSGGIASSNVIGMYSPIAQSGQRLEAAMISSAVHLSG